MPQQATKHSLGSQTPAASNKARPSDEEIRVLAYALWQARGCRDGMADEDWFNAEKELIAKAEESERLLAQV